MRPRILLADDHAILVEGLRALLEPVFEVVGAAENGRKAIELAGWLRPDVVVLDVSMPDLNGIEAARKLAETNPEAKLVILTMHADLSLLREALAAGASAYVLKHSAPTELVEAVHEALKGRRFLSPRVRELLGGTARNGPKPKVPGDLTAREREVLQLLAEGHAHKEIAHRLGISPRTVEFHKNRISEKLGVRSTAELTAYALRHKIAHA